MFQSVVARILRTRNFSVTIKGNSLFAEREDSKIFIGLPFKGELEDVLAEAREWEGKRLIVPLFPISEEERREVEDEGGVVLEGEDLEKELIREILRREDLSLDAVAHLLGAQVPDFTDSTAEEMMLDMSVGAEEAGEMGRAEVGMFQQVLELVPHWAFKYEISHPILKEERGGFVMVNAVTGTARQWEQEAVSTTGITVPHKRVEPVLDEDDAASAAKELIVELETVEVESVEESGGAVVTERKRFVPDPEDIALEPLGLLYMPFWCMEGTEGAMILNATTGEVVQKESYLD